jgi:hypothetical protein
MVVLVNPASGGASRRVLCVSRSGFEGGAEVARSRAVHVRIRGCRCHEAVRGIVAGVAVSCRRMFLASGMVVQWSGWSHRADGDGGDRSHWPDVAAPSRAGIE